MVPTTATKKKKMGSAIRSSSPRVQTEEEDPVLAEIAEIGRSFQAATRVPAKLFTPAEYRLNGYTDKQYLKLLRVFSGKHGEELCLCLSWVNIQYSFFSGESSVTFSQWIRFLEFLESPTGQRFYEALLHKARLREKRDGEKWSMEERSLITLFSAARNDYLQEEKRLRAIDEVEIRDLQQQVANKRRRKLDTELTEAKKRFLPVSDYVPMPTQEINRECLRWYLRANDLEGSLPTNEQIQEAPELFSAVVYETHLMNFLRSYSNIMSLIQQLTDYTKEKAIALEKAGDIEGSKRLRLELADAGIEVPGPLPKKG